MSVRSSASPDRGGEHPAKHLANFTGFLQADGYAGFNELYRAGGMTEVACWAHVRRKFFDIHAANGSPLAKEALDRIAALYSVIETAKLNGIDPQVWLADVLRRIADHPASRVHELLPWHWKQPADQAVAA